MKISDIVLTIFFSVSPPPIYGVAATDLDVAAFFGVSIIVIFVGFVGWVFYRSRRQNETPAKLSPPKTFVSPPASFYEPEKIFRSGLTNQRADYTASGGELSTVTLTVETPDEFPETNNLKGSAIEVEIERNQFAVVRFNRPRQRNALDQEVLAAVEYILDEVLPLHNCRIVVFTGSGDVFASGANLNEISALNRELAPAFARRGQDLMQKIADLPQLTVAAINGFCFGGALDLALACDRRIAAPNAVFSHPGVSLGIITGWGGTQRLPRLIGEAAALEMFLTAKRVDADEALRIGLIDSISEHPLADAKKYDNSVLSK